MHDAQEIERRIEEARRLPEGESAVRTMERIVVDAEAAGLGREAQNARMHLLDRLYHVVEASRLLPLFSRSLAVWDASPELVDDFGEHRMLWAYKWVITRVGCFPEIDRGQIERLLDDMEDRYRRAGHGRHGILGVRAGAYESLGDLDAAAEVHHEWARTERDEMSDCRACELSQRAEWRADRGEDAEALRVAQPVLDGSTGCSDHPHRIRSMMMLPALRRGEVDRARELHLQAYAVHRTTGRGPYALWRHLTFLALTGNVARGLEVMERHRSDYEADLTPWDRMRMLSGSVGLLRAARRVDPTVQVLTRRGGDDAAVPVGELAGAFAEEARSIAARFDARNGNDVVSTDVEARLAVEPMSGFVPLHPGAEAPTPSASSAAPIEPPVEPAQTPDAFADLDDDALLDLYVERITSAVETDNVEVTATLARREVRADGLRGAYALLARAMATDAPADAVEHLAEAEQAMLAAGAEDEARLARIRAAVPSVLAGKAESTSALEHGLADLDDLDDVPALRRAVARVRLGQLARMAGDADVALALAEDGLTDLARAPEPCPSVTAALYALAAEAAEPDGPEAVARWLQRGAQGCPDPLDAAALRVRRALLLAEVGQHAEATDEAAAAVAAADGTETGDNGWFRWHHGKVLLHADDPDAARPLLDEASRRLARVDFAPFTVTVLLDQARAHLLADRPLDAAAVLEFHLDRVEALGVPELRFDVLTLLGDAQDRLVEPAMAAQRFDEAAEVGAAQEWWIDAARCRERATTLWRACEQYGTARISVDAGLEAVAHLDEPALEYDLCRQRGQLVNRQQGKEPAYAALDRAAALMPRLDLDEQTRSVILEELEDDRAWLDGWE